MSNYTDVEVFTRDIAVRMRTSGLYLPTDRKYKTKRLKEIAIRQQELRQEISKLDDELLDMKP